MNKLFFFALVFINISLIRIAYAEECKEVYHRKDESYDQFNVPTLKALELQDYDNDRLEKKYYPFPLSRAHSQQYLTELLATYPPSTFNPTLFTGAIAACDYTTLQRYIDHGINFHCYNQEGSTNVLHWFLNCRNPNVGGSIKERNTALESVLKAGADPNQGEKDSRYTPFPLAEANEGCDTDMLDLLLKYNANPNFKTTGQEYFPVLDVCGMERRYNNISVAPGPDSPPAKPMPLAHVMESLFQHGADPNTIYLRNDRRNLATQDRAKVLQIACSGQDSEAKSLYDLYADEFLKVKVDGDLIQTDNYEKLFEVLRKYQAKPLRKLCLEVR